MLHKLLEPLCRLLTPSATDRQGRRHFRKAAPGPMEDTAARIVASQSAKTGAPARRRYSQNPADRGIWL